MSASTGNQIFQRLQSENLPAQNAAELARHGGRHIFEGRRRLVPHRQFLRE